MKWNSFSKSTKRPPNLSKLQWLPNFQYKTVHYGLVFLNLPAPLHYLNFLTLFGVPNIPVLHNPSMILTTELDTAFIFNSSSLNHLSCLQSYSIQDECEQTTENVHLSHTIKINKGSTNIHLHQQQSEIQCELEIQFTSLKYTNHPLHLGIVEQWLCPVAMKGMICHKEQRYHIESMGVWSYARTIQLPFWNWYFYTRQIIQLEHLQLIFYQIRNRFNQIIHSKLIIFDLHKQKIQTHSRNLEFEIVRVYPRVNTPNGLNMYLPREFSWHLNQSNIQLQLFATARGDYKFGFGAGYVGSFSYKLKLNDQYYESDAGYCEYVDCRALKWQEMNDDERQKNFNFAQDLACHPLKRRK